MNNILTATKNEGGILVIPTIITVISLIVIIVGIVVTIKSYKHVSKYGRANGYTIASIILLNIVGFLFYYIATKNYDYRNDAPPPQVVKVDNTGGQGWVIASMIIFFPFGLILGLIYFLSKPSRKICVTIAKILVTIIIIGIVITIVINVPINANIKLLVISIISAVISLIVIIVVIVVTIRSYKHVSKYGRANGYTIASIILLNIFGFLFYYIATKNYDYRNDAPPPSKPTKNNDDIPTSSNDQHNEPIVHSSASSVNNNAPYNKFQSMSDQQLIDLWHNKHGMAHGDVIQLRHEMFQRNLLRKKHN